MKSKPSTKKAHTKPSEHDTIDLQSLGIERGILASILDGLSINVFNPFPDYSRAQKFFELESLLRDFGRLCTDIVTLEEGTRNEIKENSESLKQLKVKINDILDSLVPKKRASKQLPVIRTYRRRPKELVYWVELLKVELKKYYYPPYKSEEERKEDIEKFWLYLCKKPYPKRIPVDTRSQTHIILSIIAYLAGCSFKPLRNIYYSIPRDERQKVYKTYLVASQQPIPLFLLI